mmetsp:Transcript_20513/g.30053  ORF Transcript_20513/g.30053 Transcript_20513/m.30053 type:complete len:158 (+) Transcript_20513:57-530(+)|eukprot:CAMPEP_0197257794 /NCGR_PEP_ID=MMETSP1429-20130617/79971_1 /TAXON_ID=49237 /ORGANISM="Chaetoceros  sp., Strain UNC1202" /LENGTH=157 /DNA_ID=CAMNT_0042721733 /DNA_START=36 /DNA_END=509 /DNA_ORIENTATION=-
MVIQTVKKKTKRTLRSDSLLRNLQNKDSSTKLIDDKDLNLELGMSLESEVDLGFDKKKIDLSSPVGSGAISQSAKVKRSSFNSKISIDTEASGSANCCHICLEDFKSGDVIGSSKNSNCPHMFHEECITNWLIIPHNECPVCKAPFLVRGERRDDTV